MDTAAVTAAIALDGRVLPTIAAGFVAILLAQRGLQTLVHHLSHDLLSKNRAFNDRLGNWLVAGFIGMRIQNYRRVHFVHHAKNGSKADPEFIDFSVVEARGGLLRYMLHFVIGGETLALVRKYYAPKSAERRHRAPPAAPSAGAARSSLNSRMSRSPQLVLIALFAVVADAWYLYLVWLYVAVTWSPMMSRLRFLVEHPGKDDRTVSYGAMVRVARLRAFQFNYHFEHHVWPSLPPYSLRGMHGQLDDEGFFARHPEYTTDTFLHALRRRAAERWPAR